MQLAQRAVIGLPVAAIEQAIAFPATNHQTGSSQNFQVVTHARLANVQDLAELLHAVGIAAQYSQHLQAQHIATGLAQLQHHGADVTAFGGGRSGLYRTRGRRLARAGFHGVAV